MDVGLSLVSKVPDNFSRNNKSRLSIVFRAVIATLNRNATLSKSCEHQRCLVHTISSRGYYMAVDMFLKLDGVKGESRIRSTLTRSTSVLVLGLSQSGTAHMGGGAGSGKVSVQDISLTKYLDMSSPTLHLFCANGKHIAKGTLTCRKAGENPLEYLKIELEEIMVTSDSTGGSGGEDRLTENISLNFARSTPPTPSRTRTASKGAAPESLGHRQEQGLNAVTRSRSQDVDRWQALCAADGPHRARSRAACPTCRRPDEASMAALHQIPSAEPPADVGLSRAPRT